MNNQRSLREQIFAIQRNILSTAEKSEWVTKYIVVVELPQAPEDDPREGSGLLSMQPVGCTPWCSTDASNTLVA